MSDEIKSTEEVLSGDAVRTRIDETLESWMRQVTDALVYQANLPSDFRQSLVNAFAEYRRAIGKPLRE